MRRAGLRLALPNMSTGGSWFFNPLRMAVAVHGRHDLGPCADARRFAAAGRLDHGGRLAIVGFGLVSAAPWAVIAGFEGLILPDDWRLDLDKTNLSLWRLSPMPCRWPIWWRLTCRGRRRGSRIGRCPGCSSRQDGIPCRCSASASSCRCSAPSPSRDRSRPADAGGCECQRYCPLAWHGTDALNGIARRLPRFRRKPRPAPAR